MLELTDVNALPEGLLIKRRKGSRDDIVAWNENLSALWQSALLKRDAILTNRHQPLAHNRPVFISERTGDLIKPSSLETAKWRLDAQAKAKAKAKAKAEAEAEEMGVSYTHFTFHDLKRKGVTDTAGNK